MSESLVKIVTHDDGAVVEIVMNRPQARNALSQALLDQLRQAVADVTTIESTRVVILAGEGKSFCAGMDLRAVQNEPAKMGDLLMAISLLTREMRRADQPFIARVQGAAVGGGCGLTCVCDFAFTHAESKVGYPEVSLGVCPAVVAPWLIKRIGAGKARQLLLAGGTVSGAEALDIGMVSHIVERDDLEETTLAFARNLAKGGPRAMAVTKQWLNELDGSLDDAVLDKAARLSAEVVQSEEAQTRLATLFGAAS